MEQYVTRIGDVTIQRVIPSGGGPPEPVRVMESEELLRAVKEEPIDEDEEQEEQEEENDDETRAEEDNAMEEEKEEEERIIIKQEPQDENEEGDETENPEEEQQQDEDMEKKEDKEEEEGGGEKEDKDKEESKDDEKSESSKRKVESEGEESENSIKKKKVEIDVDIDKKKISNLRRNIREVMDETQLDEATLSAQRQEAERLRRVQDQQKYIREVQRQIQLNRQNSKTQSRVISLLQGGSTSILKSTSSSGSTTATSTGPSTVLVKLGSGQQQALNRKTLEVLRGGKSISSTSEPVRSGITRVTPGNKPAMVTPSVSIAPVKPVSADGQKKVSNDADVVTISSSSDSEDDCIVISEGEGEEEEEEEDVDPTNSGMHTNDLYNIPDEQGRVLINVGKPENEPEIFLAPQIARIIKPHQIGGVRFLFDNVVESIERFNSSTGFGCILAHSMGLGKTLQVVSFCDVFLRETSARTVMCIMPINTLQNWMSEFNMWLPTDPTSSPLAVHGEVRPRNFGIYVLNDLHKTIASRAKVVEEWNREGGVLLIGYEMYRQLSLKRPGRVRKGKKKPPEEDVEDEKNKPLLEAMHEALVRPGPDLVICDEGHRIKNSHASISHALKQIRTKRRVVLTGYPLQNNLLEYWCMVDFVRPNYLGTKTEFSNMFERPIQNGQCIDSTPQDIRLMRYRAHVLHSLLEGFVQRRSHSVLRNTLPQKEEYVLLVRMTAFQRKLYDTFMNEVVRTKAVPNPLKAFAVCCKIWNHPDILYNFLKKKEMDELQDLDLEETAALHQAAGPNSPRRPLAKEKKGKKEVKKVAPIKPEVAAPAQSQPATPDLKQDERKFDFPNPQQPQPTGAPGYDYYPPPPPPPPPYSDMSYQYHRPPGMYYQGYYQDNPNYYHGYDQGYPGYYNNFGPMDPYSGPPKNDDFNKQNQNTWTGSFANIKQEKTTSKSPKEFENQGPPKPGYQEFYPVKDEKPDVKEEKQTFLCGFSGGQVSYNYRNLPGYPNYPPYPSQEYPGWNKEGFPSYPQGDPAGPPISGQECLPAGQGNAMGQQGMFGQNQQEKPHRMNTSQDGRPHQTHGGQGNQHGPFEMSQSNQGVSGDNHSGSMAKDAQQRSHGNHDRLSGNQNIQENIQGGQMNLQGNQKDDQQRMIGQEHQSSQQSMFGGQRNDGNQENSTKNRNDPKNLHSGSSNQNIMQPSNQGLFHPLDNSMRNQQNVYGNRNAQEEFMSSCSGSDRGSTGQQSSFNNQRLENNQGNKSNQQTNIQSLGDNQLHMLGNPEQGSHHSQNMFGSQRADHGPRGNLDHHSQNVQFQNQERMAGNHQNIFSNLENQHSFHDNSNRMLGGQEHFASNQQNMFGNKRMEHSTSMNQDVTGSQSISGTQQMLENQRRHSVGQENVHSGHQQNIFGSQRSDLGQELGHMNQQNMPVNQEKQDMHHRMHSSQERHGNTQQNLFGSTRSEHKSHDNFTNSQNKHDNDAQNSKPSNQLSMFSNQRSVDIGKHAQQEHLQLNQQNIHQENSQRMQNTRERVGSSHGIYSTQDHMQGMFKGPGPQDNQLGAQNTQQNFFGNPEHGMHAGHDHMQSSQANISNQTLQQNQKRTSSSDHVAGIQQNIYQSQSEHSVQNMIKNDSHIENQQLLHSSQDRPPSQYNVFSGSENPFNQDSNQKNRQNAVENKNIQESQHGSHVNRERLLPQGMHSVQDPKHMSQQGMFNSQNIPDARWMHSNQERPASQQSMYEHGHHSRDDMQANQEKQQQFHGNQDYIPHSQQNIFNPQNNQINLLRNTDQMHGKQQSSSMGNQNVHENQYRMSTGQPGIDCQPGIMNNPELMQGNSQNALNRQNTQEHNVHHQDHSQSNPNSANNQNLQRNQQAVSHKGQETGQHDMLGPHQSKHGMHPAGEHPHLNQHSMGNPQGHPGAHLNSQSGGHYNQDGSQNIASLQGYGVQSSPQQKLPAHDSHQNIQHSMQPAGPHQNLMNRNQHGVSNSQESPQTNQQGGNSHQHPGNQHSMYNNQYHMQSDQHSLSNQAHHSSQHGKNLPMQGQQSGHPVSGQMFGNQMAMQANNQNIGSNQSHLNSNQAMQLANANQGMHVSTSVNQGLHGTQHSLQPNQSHPNNQQYPGSGPPLPSMMHGSKEMIQNNQVPCSSSYSASHHGQYMPNINQQNVPISSHNVHSEHLQTNQQNTSTKTANQHSQSSSTHTKNQSTPTKHDIQKLQSSPIQNPSTHSQNMSTSTSSDHLPQNTSSQHRIQNMLGFPPGQHPQSHSAPPFEQNVIMSKSMSGGQVLQGSQQPKHSMQNVLGKNEESNRFRSSFDEQFSSTSNDNFQKPGFYGQDFQFPFQGQFPFQENQFSEQPGPSGQTFRKEDEKKDEDKQKDVEMKGQRDGEEVKTTSTSTSTETDDDKEKKKDDEDKPEKKDKVEATPPKSGKEDPGIPYDWATELLKGYVPGDINASAKMAVFFCILEESIALGDRILVFSQSLFTLNLMEELLQQQLVPGKEAERWAKNINYYRLDGSTTAMEREKLINEFNSNPNLHLFLVSTRAGSLGINLVGANRVIVFDASWNPCHDTQAVCRVYRYGQKKPCFVYRLVTDNCLEKKIYDRQINKQGMSDRVVDECNPDAHLSIKEVTSLCWDDKEDETPKDFSNLQDSYIDVVLQKVIQRHSNELSKEPFAHESLLVDRKEKKLSQAEKRLAKRSYELEKQASTRPVYNGVNQNQNRTKPMASVRPMQAEMGQGQRQRGWIPASVWQRQGMSAQEMTLPLDVVIPTNAADRASIVLKAGQKVMVLKSPKGIYMQLENGKIIAIRTAFKVGAKKPGEQSKAGAAGTSDMNRRGIRQLGATRGRPVRAVGPVTRTPPVTVTVTKKRPPEDEQTMRREEESQSPVNSAPDTPTPMEVTVTPAEKDAPNPFTAAAAASLSSMQVSPSNQSSDEANIENQMQEKQQNSVQPQTPQPSPQMQQTQPSPQMQQTQPSPQMRQPQSPTQLQQTHSPQMQQTQPSPQMQQTQPSPQRQSSQTPIASQTQNTTPQPQTPVLPLPAQAVVASLPQISVQPLKQVPAISQSSQTSVHGSSTQTHQPQLPVQPQIAVQPQPQLPVQPQQIPVQPQAPIPVQPQPPHAPRQPPMQISVQPQLSVQPQQPVPPPVPVQPQQQTQSTPLQPQPQIPSQTQYSMTPQSIPQSQFPMQQTTHLQQPSPFLPSQKQSHFPTMQQQFTLPPQQPPQFSIPPQQQSQYLPPPQNQPPPFPMHPQSHYSTPPQMPQQPYPVQPQPQYPMQPHLQPPQYPHQFPIHPQPQFPLQPPPPQFDPTPPVAPSMLTDQLS